MPDSPLECGSVRIPSARKASRFGALSRSGDILDTLVFMIAALLIPAWLLGHLFLTFYPAPETSDSTVASGSLFGDESSEDSAPEEGADGSDPSEAESTGSGTGPAGNDDSAGADTPNLQLGALTEKSNLLQSEVDTLTNTNDQLSAEIERLKSASSAMPAIGQTDSAAVGELQSKLDSQTFELNSAKQNLANAQEQANKYQQDKQQLQTNLSALQATLEQTKADLASAKETINSQSNSEADPGSPFAAAPMEAANADAILLQEQEAKVSELSAKVKELSYNLDNTSTTLTQRDEELRQTKLALEDIRVQNGNLQTALDNAKQNATASKESTPPASGGLKLMPREVYRDFVSSKGSISKMAYIRWEGDDVIVRSFSNKRLYRLTLDRFSAPDQQYLLERKE